MRSTITGAAARMVSEDEIVLNVPSDLLDGYARGDVVTLDCVRAEGDFEVLAVDREAQTLTVRPHHRKATLSYNPFRRAHPRLVRG